MLQLKPNYLKGTEKMTEKFIREKEKINFDTDNDNTAEKNRNCPCKRKKCPRHTHCDECRRHHEKTKRVLPCEKDNAI